MEFDIYGCVMCVQPKVIQHPNGEPLSVIFLDTEGEVSIVSGKFTPLPCNSLSSFLFAFLMHNLSSICHHTVELLITDTPF